MKSRSPKTPTGEPASLAGSVASGETPELLLFDFDGTVADTLEVSHGILNDLATEFRFKPLPREELECHVRWQVLAHEDLDVRATLPADMTPALEFAARELVALPIRFPIYTMFECRVFPVQTQTSIVTGRVRRMQRVVVLAI